MLTKQDLQVLEVLIEKTTERTINRVVPPMIERVVRKMFEEEFLPKFRDEVGRCMRGELAHHVRIHHQGYGIAIADKPHPKK